MTLMFKYFLAPYFGIVAVGKKWSTSRMYWRFLDLTVSLFSGWLSWSWLVCLHSFSAHAWRRGSFSESALALSPVCCRLPSCGPQDCTALWVTACIISLFSIMSTFNTCWVAKRNRIKSYKWILVFSKEALKKAAQLFLTLLIINDVSWAANQHI